MSYLYSIVSYLYVNCMLGERELICLLSLICSYIVSVRRGFLFYMVLDMGCVILLCHFQDLPL